MAYVWPICSLRVVENCIFLGLESSASVLFAHTFAFLILKNKVVCEPMPDHYRPHIVTIELLKL